MHSILLFRMQLTFSPKHQETVAAHDCRIRDAAEIVSVHAASGRNETLANDSHILGNAALERPWFMAGRLRGRPSIRPSTCGMSQY